MVNESTLKLKRVAGIKQTRNAIKDGSALCVYVAYDVQPKAVAEVLRLCEEYGVETIRDKSSHDIAKLCHIDVPCSASAVLK